MTMIDTEGRAFKTMTNAIEMAQKVLECKISRLESTYEQTSRKSQERYRHIVNCHLRQDAIIALLSYDYDEAIRKIEMLKKFKEVDRK